MSILDFLVVALASSACLDAWFEGSIFAMARNRVFGWPEDAFLRRLLLCRFCLGHWVPAALIMLFVAPGLVWTPLAPWAKLPLYSLAATRLAWMLHEARASRQAPVGNEPDEQ